MATAGPVPAIFQPVHRALSKFPLYTYPPLPLPSYGPDTGLPTLWIHPPSSPASAPLSANVECLKWQAWLALRGIAVGLRTDVHPEGGINGHLPTLQLADNSLHPASAIPRSLSVQARPYEGYPSAALELESRAFISLLESTLHSALFPQESALRGPISGIFPPAWLAIRKDVEYKHQEAKDAIKALGGRLGNDLWFLGSQDPTALDAAVFAYLHVALNIKSGSPAEPIRKEVESWPNLVRWEEGVRQVVQEAFQ